ncbi:MAG: DUF4956 domain-containing protein [Bacteroidota bacterium]
MKTLLSGFLNPFLQTTDPFTDDARIDTQPAEDTFNIFNIPIFDSVDFSELMMRFGINLFLAFIIVRFVYFPFNNRSKEQIFTLILFNTVIFFVCAIMRNLTIQIGFAFGLFALFGLLRYRTMPIPIKDLTYLFILICMGMINAMFYRRITYAEFLGADVLIIIVAFTLEKIIARKKEHSKRINYEKIDLIKPEKHDELIEDLKKRTGLNVHRISIERINFLRDTARIWIYYYEEKDNKKE